MSGIGGAVDLAGRRQFDRDRLLLMSHAAKHRGPDGEGIFLGDGVALAVRHLAVVEGEADLPHASEDGGIRVVFNGCLSNAPELSAQLQADGHRLRSPHDGELIAHLWEDQGEAMFDRLRGQFAFALYDSRQARVILARDRFGICPLHWARWDGWLLFGSEARTILASGLVAPRADLRGINHVFTFFGLPGPTTCFEGISALSPGQYLDLAIGEAATKTRVYWRLDFPDQGDEDPGGDPAKLVERFEQVLLGAVRKRLRTDVPPAVCLSGGVDSGLITAMAAKVLGRPIPAFTIRIGDPTLDETSDAMIAARHIGVSPTIVECSPADVLEIFPRLIASTECPVVDTACAALLKLSEQVHAAGHKSTLTGEGADEWMASYPWIKVDKLLSMLDVIPGVRASQFIRRAFLRLTKSPRFPDRVVDEAHALLGGHNGWLDVYGVMSMSKLRFFSADLRRVMLERSAYADLGLEAAKMRRLHPIHRALALGARCHLPGLLLHAKGDRITMRSAVENRYAFLDEDVVAFLAPLHPRWKLRGMTEKYLLRLLAERWLPRSIAWKRKALFRAPLDRFHDESAPAYVEQLLSPESLKRTGYFDAAAVRQCRATFRDIRAGSTQRTSIEMGLAAVVSTQLWHHLFIDPTLADMPTEMACDRLV